MAVMSNAQASKLAGQLAGMFKRFEGAREILSKAAAAEGYLSELKSTTAAAHNILADLKMEGDALVSENENMRRTNAETIDNNEAEFAAEKRRLSGEQAELVRKHRKAIKVLEDKIALRDTEHTNFVASTHDAERVAQKALDDLQSRLRGLREDVMKSGNDGEGESHATS